ncbi:MAG: hypothetical protein FJY17_04855 [Bacteroidetes bacterium]|nr:hypothetical protein [Bacteroidota bacterium]
MNRILLLFLIASATHTSAQKIDPDDSFTFELCLPNGTANKPFREIMQGVVSATPYYQYTLKNALSFGLGMNYSYYAINQFRVTQKILGGIHQGAAFLKIGHEKFWSERMGTDIGVKIGYSELFVKSNLLASQGISFRRMDGLFIEPTISYVITTDVNSSLRLVLGFPFYNFKFQPWTVGEGSWVYATSSSGDNNTPGVYEEQTTKSNASAFSIGFGYTFYFNGKKSEPWLDSEHD